MIVASEIGGFFAAHAVWCVSDGDTLVPMVAYVEQTGERKMIRLAHSDLQEAVKDGKARLQSNAMDANDAALLYDGYISVSGERLDAVIVELRTYFSSKSKATIAVPYTPKSSGAFKVHKPKLLEWSACEDFEQSAVLGKFFEGVAQHEKGSVIWSSSLDESK